jgi:hypothetical protein
MPRIIIEADDSTREVVFWERVGADDFDADHFRQCLCDRIAWAVADAEEVQRRPRQLERFSREREESRDPVFA